MVPSLELVHWYINTYVKLRKHFEFCKRKARKNVAAQLQEEEMSFRMNPFSIQHCASNKKDAFSPGLRLGRHDMTNTPEAETLRKTWRENCGTGGRQKNPRPASFGALVIEARRGEKL